MRQAAATLLIALFLTSAQAQEYREREPSACADAAACVAEVRADALAGRQPQAVAKRIAMLGDPAVVALLPMLDDPDPKIREAAAYALTDLDRIDPRHLPMLIAVWRIYGNGWIPRAIGLTGSDEALAFLQQEFLADPTMRMNQITFAITRFGDRNRPLFEAELSRCVHARARKEICRGIASLLLDIDPTPQWGVDLLAPIVTSTNSDPSLRGSIESSLIFRQHPLGLKALVRDLEAERAKGKAGSDHWRFAQLAAYGDRAAGTGPLVRWFLGRTEDRETRVEIVRTLAILGYRPAAADVGALEPRFDGDYQLAYYAADALAKLGGAPQRPVLERLAHHWHPAVRNNAERALRYLDTGSFERFAGDIEPVPTRGPWYHPIEEFLYTGDHEPHWCAPDTAPKLPFGTSPAGTIEVPQAGAAIMAFEPIDRQRARGFYSEKPIPGYEPLKLVQPWGKGTLIGDNNGEWGGALSWVGRGKPRVLIGQNVWHGFRWGGRFYVLTGLAHLGLNFGTLWEIVGDEPRAVRVADLSGEPTRLAVSSKGAVIISSYDGGDVALDRDGRLVDPERFSECGGTAIAPSN
jgi:hypothetical protein